MTTPAAPHPAIRPRETVVLACDFDALVAWYRDALGMRIVKRFDQGFRYCNLETATGIRIGIAPAAEAGVSPPDPRPNTVIVQFEVDDVRAFLDRLERLGAAITGAARYSEADRFWFGSFSDPEGNAFWVVDAGCP